MEFRKLSAAALVFFLAAYLCAAAYGGIARAVKMGLTSSAFREGEMIPQKYGFDNENLSPPLAWSNTPQGAKSIAVICDDPDAPGGAWVHWVIFNIPAASDGLPEGVPREGARENGPAQGVNDFRKIGYDGPAPPYGVHRYVFKVFALDTALDLRAGATKSDLVRAMAGHILGEGKLTGRYKKKIDIPADPML